MPGLIDWIRLSQIFLDPLFGCEEDTRLTADIRKNKLDNPLIVEGPINDHYILVDGYKRYISLVTSDGKVSNVLSNQNQILPIVSQSGYVGTTISKKCVVQNGSVTFIGC